MNQLDNIPKNDKQKSSGSTNLDIVEFEYVWTIRGFSLRANTFFNGNASIKSPIFSIATTTGTYLWFLKLSRKEDGNKRIIQISLNLESEIDDQIPAEYKFIVLNDDRTFSNMDTTSLFCAFGKDKKSHGSNFNQRILSNYIDGGQYKSKDGSNQLVKTKELNILCEGTFFVSNKLTHKLNIINLLNTKADLCIKEILEGLLVADDNMKLKEQFEEKLLCQLNIENAAEIYSFLFLHGKTEVKKKVMEFIKSNGAAVMVTSGWKTILGSSDVALITEMFNTFASIATTSNDDVPENTEIL